MVFSLHQLKRFSNNLIIEYRTYLFSKFHIFLRDQIKLQNTYNRIVYNSNKLRDNSFTNLIFEGLLNRTYAQCLDINLVRYRGWP